MSVKCYKLIIKKKIGTAVSIPPPPAAQKNSEKDFLY